MNMVMPAEIERQMKQLLEDNTHMLTGVSKVYDTEKIHQHADELLCKTLRSLGYEAAVDIYEKIPKHYSE